MRKKDHLKTSLPPSAGEKNIRKQIARLFINISAAAFLIIFCLSVMLIITSEQYSSVLQNANTAASFNKEFKRTIDSEMYNHVIRPRSASSLTELPMKELDNAVSVLTQLQQTTTLADNRWRIQSMLNMCENLRLYMTEIAETESYDTRMDLLEKNIRGETGLTVLIETYMHEYMDDEVREMVRLKDALRARTNAILACVAAGILLFVLMTGIFSLKVSRNITQPIRELSKKASRFGEGNFSPSPVTTDIAELRQLDKGFDEMAGRINTLMEKQITDQRALHKAELQLLQAQINPHFLYNTLDSIAILAQDGREEDAVHMVNSLSSFFRISLSKGKDIIPLGSEENHVRSYLQIQQIRYSNIMKYEIDIPDELKGCLVPKLILQPLVENALYHGIKNKRGLGTIRIRASRDQSDMVICVSDNGAGMDEQQCEALKAGIYEDRHTGLGLVNVHKRIRLYCGDAYGLSFESEKGTGTQVTVRLPMDLTPEKKEGNE